MGMDSGILAFSLLVGVGGVALVWAIARLLAARLSGRTARLAPLPEMKGREEEVSPEEIDAAYRTVFRRRLGGLALCAAAFVMWFLGGHWLAALALAATGCVLQYLAYRLRTCYVVIMAKQKQDRLAGAAMPPTSRPTGNEKKHCPVL